MRLVRRKMDSGQILSTAKDLRRNDKRDTVIASGTWQSHEDGPRFDPELCEVFSPG